MAVISTYHYNKWLVQDFSYFTLSEFRCNCRRCRNHALPSKLNAKLLTYLEQTRLHFGKPMIVTSGLRCKKYNASLKGSSKNSRHLTGMAADVYIHGVKPEAIRDYWKSLDIGYTYCGTPNMGNACHVQIGW
jgi:uncharacterized protein YcbK (DUF882 family)